MPSSATMPFDFLEAGGGGRSAPSHHTDDLVYLMF